MVEDERGTIHPEMSAAASEIPRTHGLYAVERSEIEIRQIPPVDTMDPVARPRRQLLADAGDPRDVVLPRALVHRRPGLGKGRARHAALDEEVTVLLLAPRMVDDAWDGEAELSHQRAFVAEMVQRDVLPRHVLVGVFSCLADGIAHPPDRGHAACIVELFDVAFGG